jgi:hypothetical protein
MTEAAMIARIASLVAAGGTAELHRFRDRAVFGILAVAALLIAFAFSSVAAFLWLTLHMAAWQAALLSAGGALALAGVFLLAGRSAARRRPREDLAAYVQAVLAEVTEAGGEMKPMARVTGALAAGIVIGRMMSR